MALFTLRRALLIGATSFVSVSGLPGNTQGQPSTDFSSGDRFIQPEGGGEDLFAPAIRGGSASGGRMIEPDIDLDLFIPLRGSSGDLPISRFPDGILSPAQVRQLRSSGVGTARELIAMDPEALASILRLSPRDAHRFQARLRNEIR